MPYLAGPEWAISTNGVIVGGHAFSYDLIALLIGTVGLILTLIVRYSFRRGLEVGGTITRLPMLQFDTHKNTLKSAPIPTKAPTARLVKTTWLGGLTVTAIALSAWMWHHIVTTEAALEGTYGGQFKFAYFVVALMLIAQLTLAYMERPIKGNGTDRHNVAVIVPVFNEDPGLLKSSLESMFYSARTPNAISVVDDGSDKADYKEVQDWFASTAPQWGIKAYWERTVNRGKRHAQITALSKVPDAQIVITVDSDVVLDPQAIGEVIKPFSNPKIQSVAGTVLASNNQVNLLARITDNIFVTGQLIDRSSLSTVGQVLVNSGGLAAYRAEIFHDNRQTYLNEKFYGAEVKFSDDSLACLFALMRGKTVHQPSAFAFTAMPQNFRHHRNQQMRWMRGSFIRSWWRLRYLRLFSWGFARQALGWVQLLMSSYILGVLLVVNPIIGRPVPWEVVAVPIVVGYGLALRYWTFKRSDMSFGSHLLNYLLTPLATLWQFFVLRPMRIWGMITCRRTGWSTRKKIEISATRPNAIASGESMVANVNSSNSQTRA